MMDDAESYWEILESDAAASVLTTADQTEVEITVEKLKSQRSMSTQCQERIFNKVKGAQGQNKAEAKVLREPGPISTTQC